MHCPYHKRPVVFHSGQLPAVFAHAADLDSGLRGWRAMVGLKNWCLHIQLLWVGSGYAQSLCLLCVEGDLDCNLSKDGTTNPPIRS